jgi:hypothetical protein
LLPATLSHSLKPARHAAAVIDGLGRKEEASEGRRFGCRVSRAMDLAGIIAVAAGLAGVVSTSLELERRVTDRQLNTRGDRLRKRAEELARFLQVLTQLVQAGVDEQLGLQTISSTRTDLNKVLQELVRIQQLRPATKVDDLPPLRRWLLLFVPTQRFAWVIHFGFYFVAWIAVLCVFEFKEVSQILSVANLVVEICACVILAVLFRHWALMEMRWAEGFRPSPSPLRRRMLWYKPSSRRELIARAGLLFGLFQIGPFFSTHWISLSRQLLDLTQVSVTLIVFYAWSMAELSLANHPVEMKFPRNLRFVRWPRDPMAWLWMICFYFMAGCTVFFVKQVMTVNLIPAPYRHDQLWHNSAEVGLTIGFVLAYLLPMYALNRILLSQSQPRSSAPLSP